MIIGLDVGGTHTDVVLLDNAGLLREVKVSTDASDLFRSVFKGLDAVTEGVDTGAIRRIVLSTTLTTNAIIQDTIPPVGMIVSAGPGIDPEHFRTNPHYVCVKGSIDHRGREVEPVQPEEIQAAAELFRKNGIRQVGVVGKFSVRNPAHEIRIGELLGDSFDKIFLGHRVSGSLNFARRIATTYLNAAVYPIHKAFFDAVLNSLSVKGLRLPLRLLKADGGNMKLEASVEYPAQTILSGPAASVMGAVAMAAGDEDAIVMDIGGTTTDLAVLIGRAPVLAPHGIAIGPYRTLIRSLETLSIGMGGDSAVRLRNGRLTVGPDREGPAILFGGRVPTPTDALAVIGDIAHDDRERARAGLKPVADKMGVPIEALADQVVETACRAMLDGCRTAHGAYQRQARLHAARIQGRLSGAAPIHSGPGRPRPLFRQTPSAPDPHAASGSFRDGRPPTPSERLSRAPPARWGFLPTRNSGWRAHRRRISCSPSRTATAWRPPRHRRWNCCGSRPWSAAPIPTTSRWKWWKASSSTWCGGSTPPGKISASGCRSSRG